ncbi:helix-turn-helix domain-containing protein [Herbaspirillum huttiense]|uniref:helix-turn-helix domain-containing protein n=1 Tax=Herbaspirillum huttiense TaxID=863372 RepID=UPI003823756D
MTLGTRIWTTEVVQPEHRFDYWIGAICECFLEMAAESRTRKDFSARLESRELAGLQLNRVSGNAQQVFRSRRAISRGDCNYYYLLCKQSTVCNVIQHDMNQARLLPGDMVLIDSRRCYQLDFPERVDTLSLQLPISWLDSWLPDTQPLLGKRIDGSSGWGAVLSAYLRQIAFTTLILPAEQHRDHLGGLIAAVFDQGHVEKADGSADRALVKHVQKLLGAHFAEPGLGAAEVAASLGVSVRTLYRALARQGMTFSSLLNQRRIEAARRMLVSPNYQQLSIAEIGRRAGWLDASHFSRTWQAYTGQLPSQTRQHSEEHR